MSEKGSPHSHCGIEKQLQWVSMSPSSHSAAGLGTISFSSGCGCGRRRSSNTWPRILPSCSGPCRHHRCHVKHAITQAPPADTCIDIPFARGANEGKCSTMTRKEGRTVDQLHSLSGTIGAAKAARVTPQPKEGIPWRKKYACGWSLLR